MTANAHEMIWSLAAAGVAARGEARPALLDAAGAVVAALG
jgi:hypothetical protein